MSADNYYIIRKHPSGGFAAVMGFASDERTPEAHDTHQSFPTAKAALDYAYGEYSEYGVRLHAEVGETTPLADVMAELGITEGDPPTL